MLISKGHQGTWWVWVYWGSSSDPSVGRVAWLGDLTLPQFLLCESRVMIFYFGKMW